MDPTGRLIFFPSRTNTGKTSWEGARWVSRTRFRSAAVRRKRRGRYCGKLDTLTLVAGQEFWKADEAPPEGWCLPATGSQRQAPRPLTPAKQDRARENRELCGGRSDRRAYHIV